MKFLILFIISILNVNAAKLDSFVAPAYKVIKSKYFSINIDKLPKNVNVNLLTLDVYNLDFNTLRYCLNLKPGQAIIPSHLYITQIEMPADCSKSLFSKKEYESDSFYNLKMKMISNRLIIKMDERELTISILNFQTKDKSKKLMQSSVDSEHFSPVDIAIEASGSNYKEIYISDDKVCFEVDDNCNYKSDRCGKCQTGSYTIINSNCHTKYSKVCGHNNCGQKGRPACIRGFEVTGFKLDYCISDSPVGFCNKGLRVFCHNETLVCE